MTMMIVHCPSTSQASLHPTGIRQGASTYSSGRCMHLLWRLLVPGNFLDVTLSGK